MRAKCNPMVDINEFKSAGMPLFACMVGIGCGITALPFYTHSLFVVAITASEGWSRSDVQFAFSLMMIAACLTVPLAGYLVDRYGGRYLGIASVILANLCFAALSMAHNISTYYLGWVAMAILGIGTLPVVWTHVVNNWFDKSRGLALGITLMGTGIAGTIGPGYAAWLLEHYGWQTAYQGLAVTSLLIGLPVLLLLLKDRPKPKQPHGYTGHKEREMTQARSGLSLSAALKDFRFWILGLSICGIALGVAGIISNLGSLLQDKNYDLAQIGQIAGVIGISVIIGRIATGLLFDRFWAPLVASLVLISPAAACLILIGDFGTSSVYIAVFITGLAAGAELDMLAFMCSRYFGLASYGRIYALQYIFFAVGASIAPTLFAWMRDHNGNYTNILYISTGLFIICSILLLAMGRYPTFKRLDP